MAEKTGKDILRQGLTQLKIPHDEQAITRLARYCDELLKWSRKINLVAKADLVETIEKHFLDSLTLLPIIAKLPEKILLDIGSGAGFPGLALAAHSPELQVTLVEPRDKRVSFLRHVIRTLGLKNVEVLCGRVEKESNMVAGVALTMPIVTSRAFTALGEFLDFTGPISPAGGTVICMKGPKAEEEIALWQQEYPNSPYRLTEIIETRLPFSGDERNLVLFSKQD